MGPSSRTIAGATAKSSKKKSRIPWTKVFLSLLFLEVASFFVFLTYFELKHENIHGDAPIVAGPHAVKQAMLRAKVPVKAVPSKPDKSILFGRRRKSDQSTDRPDEDLPVNRELRQLAKQMAKAVNVSSGVKSCRWYRRTKPGDNSMLVALDYCKDKVEGLVAYNNFTEPRILCGIELQPRKAMQISKACNEAPRLFPKDPTVSGTGMPPITVTSGQHSPPKPFECSVPCMVVDSYGISQKRGIEGTNWNFIFSMEGSHYYSNLKIDPQGYKGDHYYATTSFQSDVPLPYYSKAEYKIQGKAVDYDKAIKGASFIARNCASKNNREKVVRDLQEYFRVDSLSSCAHNAAPPNGLTMKNKTLIQQQYLFHLAFENGCLDDYITEKLWGTFESGTLPVYYGAPNVKEHVPPNSIIVVQDFKTTKELGAYLTKVASNKTLYESYHAWRTHELPESFHRKYDFTDIHSNCRLCRWGYAKKYGFGWNATTQDVDEPAIPRNVTLENGLITGVFREKWVDSNTQANVQVTPVEQNSMSGNTVQISSTNVIRKVFEHDGVTDLVIHQKNDGNMDHLILQMETDIKSGKLFRGEGRNEIEGIFRFQDDRSRLTLLTNWNARVSNPRPGVLQVSWENLVPLEESLKLRIIVESLDKFHQGGEDAIYYFAQKMSQDFFNPLKMFYIA